MLVLCDARADRTDGREVSHEVRVSHPGISEADSKPQTLIQRLDESTIQAAGLLANKDFLIARRAYWFLRDRSVTDSQQNQLEAFRRQHADRL